MFVLFLGVRGPRAWPTFAQTPQAKGAVIMAWAENGQNQRYQPRTSSQRDQVQVAARESDSEIQRHPQALDPLSDFGFAVKCKAEANAIAMITVGAQGAPRAWRIGHVMLQGLCSKRLFVDPERKLNPYEVTAGGLLKRAGRTMLMKSVAHDALAIEECAIKHVNVGLELALLQHY